jgi:hypothetical protein
MSESGYSELCDAIMNSGLTKEEIIRRDKQAQYGQTIYLLQMFRSNHIIDDNMTLPEIIETLSKEVL